MRSRRSSGRPRPLPDLPRATASRFTASCFTDVPGCPGPGDVVFRHQIDEGRGTMIRPAEPGDVAAVLGLVKALAEYEREPDAVRMTEPDLAAALFGPAPTAGALVAVLDPDTPDAYGPDADGTGASGPGEPASRVVGFAIWH